MAAVAAAGEHGSASFFVVSGHDSFGTCVLALTRIHYMKKKMCYLAEAVFG